jgi:hypothetical protein
VHKNGPGVPGAVLGSVLACAPKKQPRNSLLVFTVFFGPPMGVSGGYLVESTGYLIKYPFYMLVRVRVRACCNGN